MLNLDISESFKVNFALSAVNVNAMWYWNIVANIENNAANPMAVFSEYIRLLIACCLFSGLIKLFALPTDTTTSYIYMIAKY